MQTGQLLHDSRTTWRWCALTMVIAAVAMMPAARATPAPACAEIGIASLVATPYRNAAQAQRGIECLERYFLTRGDRRAIFASIYVITTRNIRAAIEADAFHDPVWTADYLTAFANLYREALAHHEAGNPAGVPRAWRVAFDSAQRGSNLILQDAVLGINAHVTRDLAHALARVGIDGDRALRHRDHTAINAVLVAADREVLDRLAEEYSQKLDPLGQRLGTLAELLTGYGWAAAREQAWTLGERLSDAPTATARRHVSREIEAAGAAGARRVRRWTRDPVKRARLRQLEGSDPGSAFCARFPCRPASVSFPWPPSASPRADWP